MIHVPVMVKETVEAMRLRSGDVVVDGTLGLGGHASAMATAIAPSGTLYGFDWDPITFPHASERLGKLSGVEFRLFNVDFRNAPEVLREAGLRVRAILLDLGLSSAQIDDATRGMSFRMVGPLDLRMNPRAGEPASALVNRASAEQLERIFFELGDERWARRIAQVIVDRRKTNPIRTTEDLVQCVLAAIPAKARDKRLHPATRTMQALRLAVTGELDGLGEAIEELAERLEEGGTFVVLSYHSGEDRIVKNAFRALRGDEFEELFRKPIGPSPEEVESNGRSRSAKLRALRRTSIATDHGATEKAPA